MPPCLELRAKQVDPPLQHAPSVRDLVLFFRQFADQLLEVGVGERAEIGTRFHSAQYGFGRLTV